MGAFSGPSWSHAQPYTFIAFYIPSNMLELFKAPLWTSCLPSFSLKLYFFKKSVISLPQLLFTAGSYNVQQLALIIFEKCPWKKCCLHWASSFGCFGSREEMPHRWEFLGKCRIVRIMTTLRLSFEDLQILSAPFSSCYVTVFHSTVVARLLLFKITVKLKRMGIE